MDEKPVIQLHTIDQWFGVDPQIRSLILQNIKLKDRLWKYLASKRDESVLSEPKWVPCRKCDRKGWYEVHPRYPGIHPSQLDHPCLLKLYNELVGIDGQKKVDPRLQLIFDLGHSIHHMFQTYGMNGAWGPNYKAEVPVSGDFQELAYELMIEGHADAENLLHVEIPNSPYIYEVGLVHEYKSIKSENFNKLTRPKPEHQKQALVYSACLNRPIVVYLYFSKNDSNMADFPVEFKPDLWRTIDHKTRTLVDLYQRGVAPKGETGYHCQDCQFALSCVDYRNEVLRSKGGSSARNAGD